MKIAYLCPFNLNRLTGTPIRAKTTIRAGAEFSDARVIDTGYSQIGFLSFVFKALGVLRQQRPDLIHGFTTISVIPMLVYRLTHFRVKLVFEMHGWSWFELKGKKNIFQRSIFLLLDYLGLWLATKIIAMSETEKTFLANRTWRKERIVVQWGPVDVIPERKDLTAGPILRVGYLGNSAWWQGLPYLIEAAKLLSERSDILFLLAGFDVADQEKFPPLPNVRYSGRVERNRVADFLQSCDVLVSVRLKEPVSDLQFPHKLSEYLSAGRPVIASASSDQPLVINRAQCGIIVDPLNPESLARSIEGFAAIPHEQRMVLGERARCFAAEHFAFPILVQNLQNIYTGSR